MSGNLFDLGGKRALVTGGAQGLGRMIAEGLLRRRRDVAITSRKAEVCEEAAAEMASLGRCVALAGRPVDARSRGGPGAPLSRGERRQLDILVNNAGRTWGGRSTTSPTRRGPA